MSQAPPEMFDRRRRLAMRERAYARSGGQSFLWEQLAGDLAERLADVTVEFADVLIIGPMAAYANAILGGRHGTLLCAGPEIEEDRLPFEPGSFDLIICAGTLDSVNDLPGALVQMRRALRPDGLLLAHMFGAGTLASLKQAMMLADGESVAPHIHPQVELRAAADLLQRAGFALPVADLDASDVRYGDWRTLIADLRDMGLGNQLASPRGFLGCDYPKRLDQAWASIARDGKVTERFVHLHLSGWAPAPSQPQPARRGSGQASLADILPPPKR